MTLYLTCMMCISLWTHTCFPYPEPCIHITAHFSCSYGCWFPYLLLESWNLLKWFLCIWTGHHHWNECERSVSTSKLPWIYCGCCKVHAHNTHILVLQNTGSLGFVLMCNHPVQINIAECWSNESRWQTSWCICSFGIYACLRVQSIQQTQPFPD